MPQNLDFPLPFNGGTPGGGQPNAIPVVITAAPATGATLTFNNNGADQTYNIEPAGALAALTVTFPSEATSRIGQIVRIFSTQVITALTLNGATTIRNAATAAVANDVSSYQKVKANVWDRI